MLMRSTRRFLVVFAALAAAAACGERRETSDDGSTIQVDVDVNMTEGEEPWLLPRELLFSDPAQIRARLSPDGSRMAWLAQKGGVMSIWIASVDAVRDAKPLVSKKGRDVAYFEWARDNIHLIYGLDPDGDGPPGLYSADSYTGESVELAPKDAKSRSFIVAASWDHPEQVVVGADVRESGVTDLYRVNLFTGERERIFKNEYGFQRFVFDHGLELRLATKPDDDGGDAIYELDGRKWKKLESIPPADAAATRILGFDGTNRGVYALDSRGRDAAALVRIDLKTGEIEPISGVPGADVVDVLFHPTTFQADAVRVERLGVEWIPLTLRADNALRAIERGVAEEAFLVLSRTVDDGRWIVAGYSPTNPAVYYRFDVDTGNVTRLFEVRPELTKKRQLAPMTPFIAQARDGLDLVGYLTLPAGADEDGDGIPEEPSPAVIMPEPGPYNRAAFGYSADHQWLADRGYAVVSINVRGAPGFGKAFRAAGDGEVGAGVQDDIADAISWSVERGVADPAHVAVVGAGSGGYEALASLTSDKVSCAAAYSPWADLVGIADAAGGATPNPAVRRRLGDPRNADVRAVLESRSLPERLRDVAKPMLVAVGASDDERQIEASWSVVNAAQDAGAGAALVVFNEDREHFRNDSDFIAYRAILEAFLGACLGGYVEPIAKDLKAANLDFPMGGGGVPGLPAE